MQKLAVWNVGEIMPPHPHPIYYNKTKSGICLTESFPELLQHPPPLQKKRKEKRSFTLKQLMLHDQQWIHTKPLWAVDASTHCKWDKHWQTIRLYLKGHFTFTKSKGAFVKSEEYCLGMFSPVWACRQRSDNKTSGFERWRHLRDKKKNKNLRYCVVLKKVWDSAFLCTHTRDYKRDLYLTVSRHVPIF